MKFLVGEFCITENLLNRLVAPLVLERFATLRDLVFTIRGGSVHIIATGKHLLMRFTVTGTVRLAFLSFHGREHRLELEVGYQIRPAYINLLIYGNPLAKILQGQPGVTVHGRRVVVDLDRVPQFNILKQIRLEGSEMLSLFEVIPGEVKDDGLNFQVFLNDRPPPG